MTGKRRESKIGFQHTEDFSRLNIEIQRGYPNLVKPPYVSWHLSVWPKHSQHPEEIDPSDSQKNSAKEEVDRRRNWLKANNDFISDLIGAEKAKQFALDEEHIEKYAERYFRGNVRTISGLVGCDAMLMRVEFHPEHVSYTFLLPICDPSRLSYKKKNKAAYNEKTWSSHVYMHEQTDARVDRYVQTIWSNIERKGTEEEQENEEDFRRRAAKEWDKLFGPIWYFAFKDLIAHLKAQLEVKAEDKNDVFLTILPGEIFCNFRGITLPRSWLIKAYGTDELKKHVRKMEEGGELFVPTDLTDLPSVMPKQMIQEKLHVTESFLGTPPPETPRRWNRVSAGRALLANSALRHALHWVGGVSPDEDDNEKNNPHRLITHYHRRTVANLAVDGRALYASSLSAAYDDDFNKSAALYETASRYCIFYCREDDESAQKLLDRRLDRMNLSLHSMETLRLLALKDLDGLLKVDRELAHLEREIAQAGMSPEDGREEVTQIYKDIQNLSKYTTGRVDQRAARSALYAEQFQRIVRNVYKDNQFERIEGFEPYSEFVQRRLYNQFSNIARIWERLQGSRDRLDRILELKNLLEMKSITKNTSEIARYTLSVAIITFLAPFFPSGLFRWIALFIIVILIIFIIWRPSGKPMNFIIRRIVNLWNSKFGK